jgi:hypothetical protein
MRTPRCQFRRETMASIQSLFSIISCSNGELYWQKTVKLLIVELDFCHYPSMLSCRSKLTKTYPGARFHFRFRFLPCQTKIAVNLRLTKISFFKHGFSDLCPPDISRSAAWLQTQCGNWGSSRAVVRRSTKTVPLAGLEPGPAAH